jgi:quinol monooxygenase YgiN
MIMSSVILRIKPRLEKRQDILTILHSLEGPLTARQNCLACELHEVEEDNGSILYVEQWNSREAMYAHIKSDLFLKILLVMEMAIEEPKISIGETDGEQGMQLIHKLRGGD